MFGYQSVAQLTADIRTKLYVVPADVDLIVGIPRSGMIPAYLIGLFMNRLVVDLETFLANGRLGHGSTRAVGKQLVEPLSAKHILLVDDSLTSGKSMRECLQRIKATSFSGRITTCVAVVSPAGSSDVDIYFTEMPQPRLFEWNAFHHALVQNSCFDLDGVLCVDPTENHNDDGPRYREFLRAATPLFKPTQRIGLIVSARLEKYRVLTEQWLADNNISYGALHLVDLPTQAERQRLGIHSTHKAKIYKESDAVLFYESDLAQAKDIARLSGKPVLCIADMSLYLPDGVYAAASVANLKWRLRKPFGRMKGWLRRQLRQRMAAANE